MKKRKKLLIASTLIFLLGSFLAFPVHAQDLSIERIGGKNRYETAVLVSRYTYEKSSKVIVATGENYPDALSGGTLAVQLDIPILLTRKTVIDDSVLEELDRLEVREIFLLGGEAAIDRVVEKELKEIADVKRVYGKDRYETANEISKLRFELREDQSIIFPGDFYAYVSGRSFPDALCAAPLVGQMRIDQSLNVYMILAQTNHDVTGSMIIGGPKAYDFPLIGLDHEATHRIYGKNRFETAVEVAKRYPKDLGKRIDTVVLTNGMNYPDALAAAPLVGKNNAALLLTKANTLPQETKGYFMENKTQRVLIIGGAEAVSEKIVKEIEQLK